MMDDETWFNAKKAVELMKSRTLFLLVRIPRVDIWFRMSMKRS